MDAKKYWLYGVEIGRIAHQLGLVSLQEYMASQLSYLGGGEQEPNTLPLLLHINGVLE